MGFRVALKLLRRRSCNAPVGLLKTAMTRCLRIGENAGSSSGASLYECAGFLGSSPSESALRIVSSLIDTAPVGDNRQRRRDQREERYRQHLGQDQ
jgi:hypothetical protein